MSVYFIDLTDITSRSSSLDDVLNQTSGMWSKLYDQMASEDTLWVIAPNEYRDGRMWPVAMAVADYARAEANIILKNSISVHRWRDTKGNMRSAYDEILFFVKNKKEYYFNKDRIRVAHVYQGNEWGGERKKGNSAYHDRKVSRYNKNGKDPGNVWLYEDRTKTNNQEVDEARPISLNEAVARCILATSNKGDLVHYFGDDKAFEEAILNENRIAKRIHFDGCNQEGSK